jgi:dolichol-phosphate mannosyltransferase
MPVPSSSHPRTTRKGTSRASDSCAPRIRDLTSGDKAYTRRALEAIALHAIDSSADSFQIEMTYRAVRRGTTAKEAPVVFGDPALGCPR